MKELLITLDKRAGTPLYEQIYTYIKTEIQQGKIRPGEELPSSRALAGLLAVSRSTIDTAYAQLVSEGYLRSRPCRGYFACGIEELLLTGADTALAQKTQPTGHSPQREKPAWRYDFAVNGIDPEGFPQNLWRKLARQVLSGAPGDLYQLGDPRGEEGLRRAIASYLHHARGVKAEAGQIIVGAGNDYLLMLLSVILGRAVPIAMENPTYRNAWECFRHLGHPLCAVEMDGAGMLPEALETSGAQAAYVMPSHQFPMGMVMPVKRRLQLLHWAAAKEGRYIIEDDYDSEFRYRGKPVPALQGFDQRERVIYLGTFSKALAPAVRISYMVLPPALMRLYEERGSSFSATVSRVDQKMMELFLEGGHFERHLNRMRTVYKGKRDAMVKGLREFCGLGRILGEQAGLHLLAEPPRGMGEEEAVERAARAGVRVYPLGDYYTGESGRRSYGVLLGYATLPEEQIGPALGCLRRAWEPLP